MSHASNQPAFLHVHPDDNVAVALRGVEAGETFLGVSAAEAIPPGHKMALRTIAEGKPVTKFGHELGVASVGIEPGRHVHSHNVRSSLHGDLAAERFDPSRAPIATATSRSNDTFDGYRRADGRAATRNEIWIINTVGCVNVASERIAAAAHAELAKPGSGIDGVYAFTHPFGCSQLGDDLNYTRKVLAGLARHPNAAGVLVLGLGCENNQMKEFLAMLGPRPEGRIRWFNAQEVGDEVEAGLEAVRKLAEVVRETKRTPISASELILGMKCGGSDGFSGITANPLVGRIADRLTAIGGTALLSEVPEMFGAERILLDRATSDAAFQGLIGMVNDFRGYFRRYNEPIDENPSPGNKAGGITTLAEKSLGCVQKGGRAPVAETRLYGAAATPALAGLSLVQAPGNDGVSCTAMTIAGAHMLLFTTGRGTPMGFPAPTLKIASNSDLASRKPQWIDFDAGRIATGVAGFETLTDELWQLVLDVASGRKRARNEERGHREIAIWKDGVTL